MFKTWFSITFFEKIKLNESIGKSKELWKTLKSLGLPIRNLLMRLKINKLVLGGFQDFIVTKFDSFNLVTVSENITFSSLKSTNVSKAAGLDSLCGRFLNRLHKLF